MRQYNNSPQSVKWAGKHKGKLTTKIVFKIFIFLILSILTPFYFQICASEEKSDEELHYSDLSKFKTDVSETLLNFAVLYPFQLFNELPKVACYAREMSNVHQCC